MKTATSLGMAHDQEHPNLLGIMTKEDLVNRINEILEMEHRLSVWQFLSIRKYELEEMVTRIESLYQRAYGRPYKLSTVLRETAYGKRPAYRTQYDIRHREEGTQPPLMS